MRGFSTGLRILIFTLPYENRDADVVNKGAFNCVTPSTVVHSESLHQMQRSKKTRYPSGKRHNASIKLLYARAESRVASISTWNWSLEYQSNIKLQPNIGLKGEQHQFRTPRSAFDKITTQTSEEMSSVTLKGAFFCLRKCLWWCKVTSWRFISACALKTTYLNWQKWRLRTLQVGGLV